MYEVTINDVRYTLTPYTPKIAKRMEEVRNAVRNYSVFTALESKYNFIKEVIGRDNIVESIGTFENADPNSINLAYSQICNAYTLPYEDYVREKRIESLSPELISILDKMPAIAAVLSNVK